MAPRGDDDDDLIGVDLVGDLRRLPVLRDLVICREASSHDRRGGNDNGFSNKAEYVRRERGLRTVLADIAGPGCIQSFWFSLPNHPMLPSFVERAWARWLGDVSFFVDEEESPRLRVPLRSLIGSGSFQHPVAADAERSAGGYITYAPMRFRRGFKISVDGGKLPMFFHHTWYHSYPLGTALTSWRQGDDTSELQRDWAPPPMDASSSAPSSTLTLEPGASAELFRSTEAGTIQCIRMRVPKDDAALRATWLRAWWDDDVEPSIDVPLSLLFAIENRYTTGPAAIQSNAELLGTVIGHDADGLSYFRLPMPHAERARLSLDNRGVVPVTVDRVAIEHEAGAPRGLGSCVGYLRSRVREQAHQTPGRDYELAHLHGRGHIVGTVLAVEGASETFLEGDERITTDGSRTPLIMGDATETYFNGSWYFYERAFTCPLHGAPTFRMASDRIGDLATVTMYRFHLTDCIPFRSEARFTIQHGPFNNVDGCYRSLVWYYGLPEPSLVRTDGLTVSDPADRAAHDYGGAAPLRTRRREGFFEGEQNGQDLWADPRYERMPPMLMVVLMTARGVFHDPPSDAPDRVAFSVCEHAAPYELTVAIDPRNRAVMLRRLFDQSVPDQRARVEVDGEPAGVWFNAGGNRWKIWAEDDLILSPESTAGKATIRIRIIPESPTFSAAEYAVFSIVPNTETPPR